MLKRFLLAVFAIQLCCAAKRNEVAVFETVGCWKQMMNYVSDNSNCIQTIALGFGGVAFGIRSTFQILELILEFVFKSRAEAALYQSQLIRLKAELKRMEDRHLDGHKDMQDKHKAMEDKLAAKHQAIKDKLTAELKAMEDKLAAERELRASEVALARSEAVKEFLLLGGPYFNAHTLIKILGPEKSNLETKEHDEPDK
jgi:hypothetical protein